MNQDRSRIFVGIKIAPQIAEQLAQLARPLETLARLVHPADLHITLVPPWNESEIAETIAKLSAVAQECERFVITFERLCYGPTSRWPRLLWVECRAEPQITHLRQRLFQALGQTDTNGRPFAPHVTLARMPQNGRSIARRHPMVHELALTQRAESIELFRSPRKGERGYAVLASLPLRAESSA